ncbi:MAG: hypothetical protein PWQ88_1160 [Candidatus Methanomethylophilaceae archaeon]|nr:hypothetical protein [Candidatus Methanomethylophilaceae archaeon]MDI3541949.1 hypothetical protein [Candidatus Methanomethylophilaceae archaeon]
MIAVLCREFALSSFDKFPPSRDSIKEQQKNNMMASPHQRGHNKVRRGTIDSDINAVLHPTLSETSSHNSYAGSGRVKV